MMTKSRSKETSDEVTTKKKTRQEIIVTWIMVTAVEVVRSGKNLAIF